MPEYRGGGGMTAQEEVDEFWDFIRTEELIFTRKPRKLRIGKRGSIHYTCMEHRNAWYETTAVKVTRYWEIVYWRRGIVKGGDANKWLKRAMANRWNVQTEKK
jgi:hypothetical protein